MAAEWATVAAAFVGATAGILGGVSLEVWRSWRERRAVASALGAEIKSIVELTAKRNYVAVYQQLMQNWQAGVMTPPPQSSWAPGIDPGLNAYLSKLGLLPPNIAADVATFYQQLNGIRATAKWLETQVPTPANATSLAQVIVNELALWSDTDTLGRKLITDLQADASRWWLW